MGNEALRAKQICRRTGCNTLIDAPGYCDKHITSAADRFKHLEKAKESEKFYGSWLWKKARKAYREEHPLCEECKEQGRVVVAKVVDHVTERLDIIANGGDPCDHKYLRSICVPCHQRKLSSRRWDVSKRVGAEKIQNTVGGW